MKFIVTEEAIRGMNLSMEVLEWHMEGDVRVITKAKILEVTLSEDFITEYDLEKMRAIDTSDWF